MVHLEDVGCLQGKGYNLGVLDEEVGPQYKVEGFGVHHVEPMGNASRSHRHFDLTVPTTVHHMPFPHADGCRGRDVLQVPTRQSFLGHNGYSGPSIQYPQVFTSPKSDTSPEHRGAGYFKPLLLKFLRHAHETGAFAGVRLVTIFVCTLSPLFLLGLRLGTGRRSRVWLPTRGPTVPPWRSIGVPSGLVCVLVLVRLAVRASSSTFAFATLAFAVALGLSLATVSVSVALATALATGVLRVKLRQEALLVVALVLIVLSLTTERTGDCAPVVVRQLGLAAGVGLLLLPLDHEAVLLVAVRGVKQAALLMSGITPEEVLDIAHDANILGGSPLSWSVSLVPTAFAPRAPSSRTVGVQVLVAFFLQRQVQK